MLVRISLRTTPDRLRTLTTEPDAEFEPSPGEGPAVSSGKAVVLQVPADDEDDEEEDEDDELLELEDDELELDDEDDTETLVPDEPPPPHAARADADRAAPPMKITALRREGLTTDAIRSSRLPSSLCNGSCE